MYIDSVLRMLPDDIRQWMSDFTNIDELCEIRIRVNKPIVFKFFNKTIPGRVIVANDIKRMLLVATNNSTYAYENTIKEGFLTIPGGHRIGLGGQVVVEDDAVKTFVNITFMCIRIAREVKDVARELLSRFDSSNVKNTLIVGPPGSGKTTLLRDYIRLLSDECNKSIVLIDERKEIAACVNGVATLDVGKNTDVLDGCPKKYGILMALRTMSPDIIAFDEIGGEKEYSSVFECIKLGCVCICTKHGVYEDDLKSEDYRGFKRIVYLNGKGGIFICLDV